MKRLQIILCLVPILLLTPYVYAQTKGMRILNRRTNEARTVKVYENSYAVCIGIDMYTYWPQLSCAVLDAEAMKAKLMKQGFTEVKLIRNGEATRDDILSDIAWLGKVAGKEDRVVIYFSGHGETREGRDGAALGYIIPVDCPKEDYYVNAISMGKVREATYEIKAKHILYIMDTCYSGTGLIVPRADEEFMIEMTKDPCVYMITAGKAGEQALEMSGHGIFTHYILRGLDGEADYDRNGVISGTELGLYSRKWVSYEAKQRNRTQTPQFGRIDGEGEIVFVPNVNGDRIAQVRRLTDQLRFNEAHDLLLELLQEKNQESHFELARMLLTELKWFRQIIGEKGITLEESLLTPAEEAVFRREIPHQGFVRLDSHRYEIREPYFRSPISDKLPPLLMQISAVWQQFDYMRLIIRELDDYLQLVESRSPNVPIAKQWLSIMRPIVAKDLPYRPYVEGFPSVEILGDRLKELALLCQAMDAGELPKVEEPMATTQSSTVAQFQTGASSKEIIGKDGASMVLIPAGEFQMGTDFSEILQLTQWAKKHDPTASAGWFEDETPRHTVYLQAFYMDVYEVTNAQYRRFMDETGHKVPESWNDSRFNAPDQPVVEVDWHDAVAYCDWAGKRLPTEAEWEKAARGGLVDKRYPWGNAEPNGAQCNFWSEGKVDYEYSDTAPVGSFAPNGYCLYDMAGNVWEWCADWYDDGYYARSVEENPIGPSSGKYRVIRGGSWNNNLCYLRVADRYGKPATYTSYGGGFRCVQNATP